MATTIVYPNGDGTKTNWSGVGDTTNLYANIDEGTTSPDDNDYSLSATSLSEIYFLLGDMPSDFGTATGATIRCRLIESYFSKDGGALRFDYCQLVQSNESTAITATSTITGTTLPATYAFTPTITGATDKTTWDGARLKFKLLNPIMPFTLFFKNNLNSFN